MESPTLKFKRKTTKQLTHLSSKIRKRYKRNIILGDLHRSNRISSNFSDGYTEIFYLNRITIF